MHGTEKSGRCKNGRIAGSLMKCQLRLGALSDQTLCGGTKGNAGIVTAHLRHRRLPAARPVPDASVCFSLVPSLSVWFYCLLCVSALSLLDVRFVSVVFRRVLCVSAALLYKEGLPLLFAVSLFTCPALYNLRPLLALVLFVLRRPPG